MTSAVRLKAVSGLALLLGALGLGGLALTPQVTRDDLRIDQAVVPFRFHLATEVFADVTRAAQEAVGLGALLLGIIVLLVRRRRWDAARLLAMAGAAWILALAVKYLIERPRPPASLWLMPPDPSGSYPSGHETTAVVIVVVAAMALAGTGLPRAAVTALAAVFALAVGVSRVYLGDHYPTDVIGSCLIAAAAVLLAWAVTDLPRVRRLAPRALRAPGIVLAERVVPPPLPRATTRG